MKVKELKKIISKLSNEEEIYVDFLTKEELIRILVEDYDIPTSEVDRHVKHFTDTFQPELTELREFIESTIGEVSNDQELS